MAAAGLEMCIRDSYTSISGEELNPYRRLNANCVKSHLNGYKPVSYTHLDVYKRQGLRGLNLFYMTGYVEAGILTSAAFSMPSFSEGEQSYLLCPPPSFWGII